MGPRYHLPKTEGVVSDMLKHVRDQQTMNRKLREEIFDYETIGDGMQFGTPKCRGRWARPHLPQLLITWPPGHAHEGLLATDSPTPA